MLVDNQYIINADQISYIRKWQTYQNHVLFLNFAQVTCMPVIQLLLIWMKLNLEKMGPASKYASQKKLWITPSSLTILYNHRNIVSL